MDAPIHFLEYSGTKIAVGGQYRQTSIGNIAYVVYSDPLTEFPCALLKPYELLTFEWLFHAKCSVGYELTPVKYAIEGRIDTAGIVVTAFVLKRLSS